MTQVLDSHAHIGRIGQYESTAQALLTAMDAAGIGEAVVSSLEGNEYVDDVRVGDGTSALTINRELAQLCRAQPRFRALYWVRPCSEAPGAAMRQLLAEYRDVFVGLKLHPRGVGAAIGHPAYEPYLALAASLCLPVCVHTQQDGWADTALLAKWARAWPQVNFIAVHMDLGSDHAQAMEHCARLPNLFGDTTLMSCADMEKAVGVCGAEKILFGSDAAIFGASSYERYLPHLQTKNLTDGQRELVLGGNARRLLRRKV
ncbi:MAG: amidohydrolase family protein [Eubacteriales bacterium]|nr:amidohydrolase family protein [Eubacteriales bacterium]